MNKQDNKLIISVLTLLIAGIALVYTLIQYHDVIFAVVGVSVIFLITAYLLTQNILISITMRNKSNNVQIKSLADDISAQLENMSSSQAAIGKSTYAYTKQTAKMVTSLEEKYTESQDALFRGLSTISSNNNKAAKLMIKYNQNNTNKVVASVKELRTQLNDILTQGFDQIQPDNTEVLNALQALVDYLKNQSSGMDSSMGLQLNNVAHELQNISNNIQHFQMPIATMMPTMAAPAMQQPIMPVQAAPTTEGTPLTNVNTIEEAILATNENVTPEPENDVQEPISQDSTTPVEEVTATDSSDILEELTDADLASMETSSIEEEITNETAAPLEELINEAATAPTEESANEAVATPEAVTATEEEPPTLAEDANKMLSQDEIAALLAASAPAQETPADVPDTETAEEVPEAPSLEEDPNKQLSADEIAALFAAADSAPAEDVTAATDAPAEEEAKEEEFTPTFTVVKNEDSDPNKQLSADEIAALFAAAEPAPKKEEAAPEAPEVSVAPLSDDPNKQLSADEIAALFAAAEPAPAKEPEPAPEPVSITPVSDDPNKQLSADEIAALFAQMG